MKWQFWVEGNQTRVRVSCNGSYCGDLCFRTEEFEAIRSELSHVTGLVEFIDESEPVEPPSATAEAEAREVHMGEQRKDNESQGLRAEED